VRSFAGLSEGFLIALIAVFAAINVAFYSGAIGLPRSADVAVPAVSAPVASGTPVRPDIIAESDASADLPGTFVPTQGRQHIEPYPLQTVAFCPPEQVRNDCYASNPPTSGLHLPVEPLIVLPGGQRMKVPPDPGIYDFAIPRESIPHIEEHAGVYVGYRCGGDACGDVLERLKAVVSQELSLGERVVLTPDPDLDADTIGLAAWTRVDVFSVGDYTDERVRGFIKAHSCRFDPERFCKTPMLN
jgi:Protein of unknown function (DUF3105)